MRLKRNISVLSTIIMLPNYNKNIFFTLLRVPILLTLSMSGGNHATAEKLSRETSEANRKWHFKRRKLRYSNKIISKNDNTKKYIYKKMFEREVYQFMF